MATTTTTSTDNNNLTAIKIGYKCELHRVRVDLGDFSYAALVALFESTFELEPHKFVIQYFTEEDEEEKSIRIVVKDKESFEKVVNELHDASKTLKFLAQSNGSAALYDATEPILRAIEKLLTQLNLAMASVMEKAKEGDWEGKCKRGLTATGDAIQKAAEEAKESLVLAKTKVEEFPYEKVVADTKVCLNNAKTSVEEFPYDKVLKETSEGLKAAAFEISTFAQDFAKQVSEATSTTTTTPAVPAATEENAEKAPPAPKVVVTAAKEEVVAAPAVVTTPVATTTPVTVVVATEEESPAAVSTPYSATEGEGWTVVPANDTNSYQTEIQTIKEVFPECDMTRVLALLQRYKGQVNVVLNELAEM